MAKQLDKKNKKYGGGVLGGLKEVYDNKGILPCLGACLFILFLLFVGLIGSVVLAIIIQPLIDLYSYRFELKKRIFVAVTLTAKTICHIFSLSFCIPVGFSFLFFICVFDGLSCSGNYCVTTCFFKKSKTFFG